MILSSTALTDGELTLRPLERDDRDPMYAAVMESLVEVSRWLPWCHPGYSIAETEAFIESCITAWAQQAHFPFAIFDARTSHYLGGTGVNHIDRQNRQGSVGYWVRTSATSKGLRQERCGWWRALRSRRCSYRGWRFSLGPRMRGAGAWRRKPARSSRRSRAIASSSMGRRTTPRFTR